MEYTHIDLFSGIGGFALAAHWAGIKTVQFVEIDPFCQKILNKNFPGVPIHGDIKTFTYNGTSPFILTGGFPCQPFSCAGKRQGKEDDRYLWPEMLRVISEARPRWVIGENVGGFVNMGLDECISGLEAEGYEVQPFIIPACAKNAPHRRDRVWIIAYNQKSDDGRYIGKQKVRQEPELGSGAKSETSQNSINGGMRGRDNGNQGGMQCSLQVERPDSHAPDTESGQSWEPKTGNRREDIGGRGWQEPWFEVAIRLCRVDDGVPRKLDRANRLKALGNAIVPQIAFEIMKAIKEVMTTHQT